MREGRRRRSDSPRDLDVVLLDPDVVLPSLGGALALPHPRLPVICWNRAGGQTESHPYICVCVCRNVVDI